MAFDGIFLRHIINEISPCVTGARVEKIHQPSREELVIHLRSKSGAYKLFLSIRASGPRIHFITETPENPASPPMFCMLMRKKLTNSILREIRQSGLDRVVYFDFDAINELGDRVTLTLSVEIMAKHSNIMLTDENGKFVDALKRIDFSRSEVRQILPGFPYTPPPAQDKLDLLGAQTDTIIERVKTYEFKAVSSALLNSVQGLSPLVCREIAFRCGEDIAVCDMNTAYEAKLSDEIERLKSMRLSASTILPFSSVSIMLLCFAIISTESVSVTLSPSSFIASKSKYTTLSSELWRIFLSMELVSFLRMSMQNIGGLAGFSGVSVMK